MARETTRVFSVDRGGTMTIGRIMQIALMSTGTAALLAVAALGWRT